MGNILVSLGSDAEALLAPRPVGRLSFGGGGGSGVGGSGSDWGGAGGLGGETPQRATTPSPAWPPVPGWDNNAAAGTPSPLPGAGPAGGGGPGNSGGRLELGLTNPLAAAAGASGSGRGAGAAGANADLPPELLPKLLPAQPLLDTSILDWGAFSRVSGGAQTRGGTALCPSRQFQCVGLTFAALHACQVYQLNDQPGGLVAVAKKFLPPEQHRYDDADDAAAARRQAEQRGEFVKEARTCEKKIKKRRKRQRYSRWRECGSGLQSGLRPAPSIFSCTRPTPPFSPLRTVGRLRS